LVALAGCDHRMLVGRDPRPDLTSDLVAYWTFDDNPLTAIADASGNANHGNEMSFSVTDQVPGVHGSALGFGQAGWFVVADSPTLDRIGDAFSVATWLMLDRLEPARGVLLERRAGAEASYALTLEGGVLSVRVGATACTAPLALATGRWRHAGASYDGVTLQLFVDGGLVQSCAAMQAIAPTTAPLTVGTALDTEPFDKLRASLDDLALWSRALDADALAALAAGDMPS
jgi:hypothetical protein